MTDLLVLGLGYTSGVLARRLALQGWSITGTSRTAEGARCMAQSGWRGIVFDGTAPSPGVSAAISAASHILVSVPPGDAGDPALTHHGPDIAVAANVRWIGYLSTVGVYGDHQGAWVDEDTPPRPVSTRSRRRVQAETAWLDFGTRSGKAVHIFRLAGIYGPGRSAIDNLRSGSARRIDKPGQVFNRIHVEDIATVLEASIMQPRAGAIYNVADLEPSPPQDVVAYAAGLLGMAVPPLIPFEKVELSEMGRGFYGENKRVSSALVIAELGVTFAYPTYREGMAAIAGM